MAEVYWVHLPEHTDMFSEGYIGVTSRNAQFRFNEHVWKSKGSNSYFHNVIRKYGRDNLIVETLVICELPYAFEVESKLRPDKCIGWNLASGGYNSGIGRNRRKTEEEKKVRGDALRGVPKSPEHIENMRKARIEWHAKNPAPIGVSSTAIHEVWCIADELYTAYHLGTGQAELCKQFGFKKISNVTQICKHFKAGWNPLEDSDWINRYKKAEPWPMKSQD